MRSPKPSSNTVVTLGVAVAAVFLLGCGSDSGPGASADGVDSADDVGAADESPAPDPGATDEAPADDGAGTPDPGEPDPEPDIAPVDTTPPDDGPCEPSCAGRVCGPDGCGGICGFCTHPLVCDEFGQCVAICVRECKDQVNDEGVTYDKQCGPDACGGQCGTCDSGLECRDDGLCYQPDEVGDCTGKQCGSDGAGGTCGECDSPRICSTESFQCILGPCGVIDSEGLCEGEVAKWCEDKTTLREEDCSDTTKYANHECTYDGLLSHWACREKGDCIRQCTDKQCGEDGCGGTCGTCTTGWGCLSAQCEPKEGAPCGSVAFIGECRGNVVWFCSKDTNQLAKIDCDKQGGTCGWSGTSYDCE